MPGRPGMGISMGVEARHTSRMFITACKAVNYRHAMLHQSGTTYPKETPEGVRTW